MAINLANNNSLANITALPSSISGGAMTLLATQTASGSATLSFTDIDDTYDEYVFKFYNMHPATNNTDFSFNMSVDGGSNYNVVKTTTYFRAYHRENGTGGTLEYNDSKDLAQSTSFQPISVYLGNENDESCGGTLQLFNPSSTTFVKHFISTTNEYNYSDYTQNSFVAGYANTTSAVDAIQFKMSSGNIDSGVIKLYGVS